MVGSRFALLKELPSASSSAERRELMRQVTDALGDSEQSFSEAEFGALDALLSTVAREYSTRVRAEFAQLVASNATRFSESARQFALDEIEVSEPILLHSKALPDDVLITVAREKSQAHKLAVTKRHNVSAAVSHALVEHGDNDVIRSLLRNDRAQIGEHTYDKVLTRAETDPTIQTPLVRRQGVPLDILHELYQKVEGQLRGDILTKFNGASEYELEQAFKRSRKRITNRYVSSPEDMPAARKKLESLQMSGRLKPTILPTLLREGAESRTLFKLTLAHLTDVEFHVVDRTLEAGDLDTLALLCRGAQIDKELFTSLALGLDRSTEGLAAVTRFGELYDSVPVAAAQRAIRFWKVRNA